VDLELTPLGEHTRASIRTPLGTFSGRDYRLRIVDREAAASTRCRGRAARIVRSRSSCREMDGTPGATRAQLQSHAAAAR